MRPVYHYAPAANWLSDPNGLVHHDGEWHLFYQYNPQGEDWGHMSWGHAVSRDLSAWQELPVAIEDDARAMIFSGSAVVDSEDRAGFGKGALVAHYTAAAVQDPPHQSQALAFSTDRGRTWQKYRGNPVIDRGLADFRDPNVFWHAPTGRWIMVVVLSADNCALIYASRDLRQWDELSTISGVGAPGRVWECPLLIELPVEGTPGETRWLFKVDALHDAPGSGAIYQTGIFDGTHFHPDGAGPASWHAVDHGRDFYAAIAWHEPRDDAGRPLWIGWLGNHTYQGRLPYQGWRGAMSLPRRLSLRLRGGRYVLLQTAEPAAIGGVAAVAADARQTGQAARIALPGAMDFSLTIGDREGRRVTVERRGASLQVSRQDPCSPFLDAACDALLDGATDLTLWLDAGSAELLTGDGALALSLQHRLAGEPLEMHLALGTSKAP